MDPKHPSISTWSLGGTQLTCIEWTGFWGILFLWLDKNDQDKLLHFLKVKWDACIDLGGNAGITFIQIQALRATGNVKLCALAPCNYGKYSVFSQCLCVSFKVWVWINVIWLWINLEDMLLQRLPLAVVTLVWFCGMWWGVLLVAYEGWVGQEEEPDLMRNGVRL